MSKNNWQQEINQIPPFSSVQIKVPDLNFFQSLQPKNQKIIFTFKPDNSASLSNYSINYPNHYLELLIGIGSIVIIIIFGGIILTINRKSKK